MAPSHSDVAPFTSLLSILDDALVRRPDRPALGLRGDDGLDWHWTYRELDRRSKLAAFRLRALGLGPGDRLITWSPSSPELPAVYFGAMRARVAVVPLDLRMAPETVTRIVARSGARLAALGTGRGAPDPHGSGLGDLPLTTTSALTADPAGLPADWEAQVDAWERPGRDDLFEVVFTSGTTGAPKGVMPAHGAILSSIEAGEPRAGPAPRRPARPARPQARRGLWPYLTTGTGWPNDRSTSNAFFAVVGSALAPGEYQPNTTVGP